MAGDLGPGLGLGLRWAQAQLRGWSGDPGTNAWFLLSHLMPKVRPTCVFTRQGIQFLDAPPPPSQSQLSIKFLFKPGSDSNCFIDTDAAFIGMIFNN